MRRRVTCPTCKKQLAGAGDALRRHMRIHTGERPHTCATCGRGFSQASSLHTHEFVHSGKPQFACPICLNAFRFFANVRRHISRKHAGRVVPTTFEEARRAADVLCADDDTDSLRCDETLSVSSPESDDAHGCHSRDEDATPASQDFEWEEPAAIGFLPPLITDEDG